MLGLLVYFHLVLDISVCHGYVRVACLFLGNNDALCVRQVPDARILQAVKLVLLGKSQGCAHLTPFYSQLVVCRTSIPRFQAFTEDIILAWMLKYLQLNHELQYLIIQGNKSIFPVLLMEELMKTVWSLMDTSPIFICVNSFGRMNV